MILIKYKMEKRENNAVLVTMARDVDKNVNVEAEVMIVMMHF